MRTILVLLVGVTIACGNRESGGGSTARVEDARNVTLDSFTQPSRVMSDHTRPPLDDHDGVARMLLAQLRLYRDERAEGTYSVYTEAGIRELATALCRLEGRDAVDVRGPIDWYFDLTKVGTAKGVRCLELVE